MNYKIKVNNEAESKEVQGLFFELGYVWHDTKCKTQMRYVEPVYYSSFDDMELACDVSDVNYKHKEITLPELRDLAVLKRNNRKDANVSEENCLYDLYLTESKELYFYHCGKNKWILSNLNGDDDYYESLKPIEKPMKEYLLKTEDGTYHYHDESHDECPKYVEKIEIPDGAEKATLCNEFLIFWKDDFLSLSQKNGDTDFTFDEKEDYGFVEYMDINDDAKLIWKRETLNDKVASAECFRKSFVPNSNEIAKAIVSSLNDEDNFLNEIESHLIDNVNHPSHYASGEIECIDAMRAMLGREQFIGYIRGNMFKYQWRYQNKNGIEDLKKSEWYLNKLLEVENEL